METPTDYTKGSGSEQHPNKGCLNEAINRAIMQKLRKVECAILTEPMTFRVLVSPPAGAMQIGGTYLIEYKGQSGTY